MEEINFLVIFSVIWSGHAQSDAKVGRQLHLKNDFTSKKNRENSKTDKLTKILLCTKSSIGDVKIICNLSKSYDLDFQ